MSANAGTTPTENSGGPNVGVFEDTIRSQDRASSNPPPKA
jgi:hypothetical protein